MPESRGSESAEERGGGPAGRATAACLERIARLDPTLHAFITVTAGAAREAAAAADAAARDGRSLGPLHGMPIAVKDCIDVAGVRCTHGSAFFADRVASADAAVVAHLRAAGAVLLGKTNMHEFAYGGTTQNAVFGGCRNPFDPTRIPGGSSGGSAVAVAAGMAVGALGSDTGASIRMPAALTGITGLRPTWGSVSSAGVLPVSPPHDVVGPMARSAADVALILRAIVDGAAFRRRRLDPDQFVTGLGGGVAGLTIAVPDDFFFAEADGAIAEAVLAAARVLERQGARLVRRSIPGAAEAQANLMPVLFADAASYHRERLEAEPGRFSAGVLHRLEPGLALRAVDYARHMRWLEAWRGRCGPFFSEVDAVITPTVPVTAPEAGDDLALSEVTSRLSRFCWAWPAAGVPAISVPCGFVDGLPAGLQIAAGRWQDGRVLRIAHAYQQATDWHRRRPPSG